MVILDDHGFSLTHPRLSGEDEGATIVTFLHSKEPSVVEALYELSIGIGCYRSLIY
jgi:hypothetical protein